MDISQLTKFIKLPPSIIYIIFIITGILLFSENTFLEKLALQEFKTEYNLYIGIIFLLSLGMSVVNLGKITIEYIKIYKINKKNENKIKHFINNLDEIEKSILREFKIQQQNAIVVSMEDETVMSLISNGIIEQIGTTASHSNIAGTTFNAKLSELAKRHMTDDNIINQNGNNPRPKFIEKLNLQKSYENKITELGKYLNI